MKRLFPSLLPAALLTCFCLSLWPLDSHAKSEIAWLHEIRAGLLDHDTNNLWSGSSYEGGIDVSAEIIFTPAYGLWQGHIRPNAGFSINSKGDTSKIYAGGVWQYLWKNGCILDIGAGLALHDGETDNPEAVARKELGSRVLLHFSLELGYSLSARSRLFFMFDHISNGYTADPNEGLDTLGIRYGYLF
jgi:lipid A 3-O-deacylase